MAKRATVLKVSGLRRAFGPNTIFEKFNLEVRAGEAIALTGRNGAGKSTLLRCLVGADRADDGTIEVCGNPMSETDPQVRRDVATEAASTTWLSIDLLLTFALSQYVSLASRRRRRLNSQATSL